MIQTYFYNPGLAETYFSSHTNTFLLRQAKPLKINSKENGQRRTYSK